MKNFKMFRLVVLLTIGMLLNDITADSKSVCLRDPKTGITSCHSCVCGPHFLPAVSAPIHSNLNVPGYLAFEPTIISRLVIKPIFHPPPASV